MTKQLLLLALFIRGDGGTQVPPSPLWEAALIVYHSPGLPSLEGGPLSSVKKYQTAIKPPGSLLQDRRLPAEKKQKKQTVQP